MTLALCFFSARCCLRVELARVRKGPKSDARFLSPNAGPDCRTSPHLASARGSLAPEESQLRMENRQSHRLRSPSSLARLGAE